MFATSSPGVFGAGPTRALQIRQNPETRNQSPKQPEPRSSVVARRYDIDKNEIGSGGYGKAGVRAEPADDMLRAWSSGL